MVVGAVSFPFLVTLGHAMFGQMGVSEAPTVGPDQDPGRHSWKAYVLELSATVPIGGTFLAAALAMLIAASMTRRPGITPVDGLVGGAERHDAAEPG